MPVSWRSSTLAPPERSLNHHQRPRAATEERNLGRRGTWQTTSTQSTPSVASLLRDFLGSPRSSFSGRALTGHRPRPCPFANRRRAVEMATGRHAGCEKLPSSPQKPHLSQTARTETRLRGSVLKPSWKFPLVKLRLRSRRPIGTHTLSIAALGGAAVSLETAGPVALLPSRSGRSSMSVGFGRIGGARGVGAINTTKHGRENACLPVLQPSRQPPCPSASQHGRAAATSTTSFCSPSITGRGGPSCVVRAVAAPLTGPVRGKRHKMADRALSHAHPWTVHGRAGENKQTGTRHDPGGNISNRRATGPGAQLTMALSQQRHQTPPSGQPKLARGRGMKGQNGQTTLAGCWRETCPGTRPRGNVSRVRRGSALCCAGPGPASPCSLSPRWPAVCVPLFCLWLPPSPWCSAGPCLPV